MYERTGMGYSELNWWETVNMGLVCEVAGPEGKSTEICFRQTPEDEAIAHGSNCTRFMNPIQQQLLDEPSQQSCHDDGLVWCCPEGYPRPYMQNIPSDVSSYEEERRRLLAQDPTAQTPDEPQPDDPNRQDPRPVHQRSFFDKLTHPGAITAIVTFVGGGTLLYLLKRRREQG